MTAPRAEAMEVTKLGAQHKQARIGSEGIMSSALGDSAVLWKGTAFLLLRHSGAPAPRSDSDVAQLHRKKEPLTGPRPTAAFEVLHAFRLADVAVFMSGMQHRA
jgi:hypothetical protein